MNEQPISVCYLYRQRLPAAAPQAIQILSTAHALAKAGAWVQVLADAPLPTASARLGILTQDPEALDPEAQNPEAQDPEAQNPEALDPEAVLQAYGLSPHPRLSLKWLPPLPAELTGLAYRAEVMRWLFQARRRGHHPVLYCRRVDYAAEVWVQALVRMGLALLVYEWHYLASANAFEAGDPRQAARLRRLESRVLRAANAHCVVSSGIIPWLRGQPPAGPLSEMPLPSPTLRPVWVIPNGGPEVSVLEGQVCAEQVDKIAYAGLFRRPQDFTSLLNAVQQLPRHIQVDIFGGDEDGHRFRDVQSSIRRAGLEARVVLRGGLSPAVLRKVLTGYSFALATFADSVNMQSFACPLKVLEYQAVGLPVIASDFPTVRALITHQETGLLVAPNDSNALAQSIVRLLHDRQLRDHLRSAGLRQAGQRTWLARGELLFSHLRSLVRASG